MTILTYPTTIIPTSMRFILEYNTQTFRSPLTKSVQTKELVGAVWSATMDFVNLPEANVRILNAFLASLRGTSGRFNLFEMLHATPSGTIAGSPVVSGGGQTGNTVNTTGWTGTLLRGDYIGVGNDLKIVSADVTGPGVITFEPPIRVSPADASAIVTNSPTVVMGLSNDKQAGYQHQTYGVFKMKIDCVERFT